jgi:hypothetical protein
MDQLLVAPERLNVHPQALGHLELKRPLKSSPLVGAEFASIRS